MKIKNYNWWIALLLSIIVLAGCRRQDIINIEDNKVYEIVREELNISYGMDPLQKMDIYFPEGFSMQTPVVFYIHGGGFVAGLKDEVKDKAKLFTRKGYVTVNLSHRLVDATGLDQTPPVHKLSPVKVTDQVADIDAAVLKYNSIAAEYGAGTEKMYMAGHSAGGTLAMLYVQGNKNKDRMVLASANLAGLTNLTIPQNVLQNPPAEPFWPAIKELMYRMTGAEVSQANALFLMAISADWVSVNLGGRPNITVMPKSNDDDLHLSGYKNTVAEAQQYDKQLKAKGINSSFVLMDTDHGFGNHPDDWEKAIKYTTDFFKTVN